MGFGSRLRRAVRKVAKVAVVGAATYFTGGAATQLAANLVYKPKQEAAVGGEPIPIGYSQPYSPGFSYGGYDSAGSGVLGGGAALGSTSSGPTPIPFYKNPFFLIGGGLVLFFGGVLLIRR